MNGVFFPWMVAVGMITVDDLANDRHLPVPSRFIASFVAFGLLAGLAGTGARGPAIATAWGLDVAMLLNLTQTNAGVFTRVGAFLAGGAKGPSNVAFTTSQYPQGGLGPTVPQSQLPFQPGVVA